MALVSSVRIRRCRERMSSIVANNNGSIRFRALEPLGVGLGDACFVPGGRVGSVCPARILYIYTGRRGEPVTGSRSYVFYVVNTQPRQRRAPCWCRAEQWPSQTHLESAGGLAVVQSVTVGVCVCMARHPESLCTLSLHYSLHSSLHTISALLCNTHCTPSLHTLSAAAPTHQHTNTPTHSLLQQVQHISGRRAPVVVPTTPLPHLKCSTQLPHTVIRLPEIRNRASQLAHLHLQLALR